jgi:hypothetical protein
MSASLQILRFAQDDSRFYEAESLEEISTGWRRTFCAATLGNELTIC